MIKKILTITTIAVLVTSLMLVAIPASADDTTCTVIAVVVADNLIVPPGATCLLLPGSSVAGNVKVESGATFSTFFGGVTIGGDVQAQQARQVSLVCTTVGGDVLIQDSMATGLGPAFTRITANDIGGNVQIEKQSSGSIEVGSSAIPDCPFGSGGFANAPPGVIFPANTVGGDVQLKDNTTPFNPTVGPNTIGGNLQCEKNTPGPIPSGFNAVVGAKEGQCTPGF